MKEYKFISYYISRIKGVEGAPLLDKAVNEFAALGWQVQSAAYDDAVCLVTMVRDRKLAPME